MCILDRGHLKLLYMDSDEVGRLQMVHVMDSI